MTPRLIGTYQMWWTMNTTERFVCVRVRVKMISALTALVDVSWDLYGSVGVVDFVFEIGVVHKLQ